MDTMPSGRAMLEIFISTLKTTSYGRGHRLTGLACQRTRSCGLLSRRCPHNVKKGTKHEQVQESIACDLALSIPPGVGSEISVPGIAGADRAGGVQVRDGVLSAVGLRGGGTECAGGSRPPAGKGAAEAVDLGTDGRPERTYGDKVVQRVSSDAQEAVLGKSFLGEGLLRRYGGSEQRDDPEIRSISGEGRAASGAATTGATERTFSEGPLVRPPMGGIRQNHVLRTWFFTSMKIQAQKL